MAAAAVTCKRMLVLLTVAHLWSVCSAQCARTSVVGCIQELYKFGVTVEADGTFDILGNITFNKIETACKSVAVIAETCLKDLLPSCDENTPEGRKAAEATAFLEYICSKDGLLGLKLNLECLTKKAVREATGGCSYAFDGVKAEFSDLSFQKIVDVILLGDGIEQICEMIFEVRVCYARMITHHCSIDISAYNDKTLKKTAEKLTSLLGCPDRVLVLKPTCSLNICQNGGTCYTVTDNVTGCLCADGFRGPHCELLTECRSDLCENGGSCSNASAVCRCRPGFSGTVCNQSTVQGVSYSTLKTGFITIIALTLFLVVMMAVSVCWMLLRRKKQPDKMKNLESG